MASSTSPLDLLVQSQMGHTVTANDMFNSASPAMLFARRALGCTGLTWAFYGGVILVDGTPTTIANGTVALTASQTNYVECNRSGAVTANTTSFTAGKVPLYSAVVGASTVTTYTEQRAWVKLQGTVGLKAIALSDVNTTLTATQASCEILEFTGTLTTQRNIVVPLGPQQWTIYNGTTHGLQIIGATGTGVVIATTKTAIVYSNGTNVRRATADV